MPLTPEVSHHTVLNPTLAYVTYGSPISEEPSWDDGSNVMGTQRGYLERRPGLVGVESSQTSFTSIQRVFTWRRWAGDFFIMLNDVTATQSLVYKLRVGIDSSFTLIHTSAVAVPFDFQVANNFLFFGNGNDMKKWNGTTVTNWGISVASTAAVIGGPNSAGAGANAGLYSPAWTNPGNITAADATYADVTMPGMAFQGSDVLFGSAFGFAVPSTANITGLQVDVRGYADASGLTFNCYVIRGGAIQGTDGTTPAVPLSNSYTTFGGLGNLWGTSWSAANVNLSTDGFGVTVGSNTIVSTSAHIDHMRLTVYYNTATTPTVATSATGITGTVGYKYVACYENINTAHLSSPTTESASTGAFVNKQVDVGTFVSTDTQVTGIRIFRTTDGGGVAYFGITGNPFANTTGTKADTTADTALSSATAPTSGFNDPPPNSYGFAYWANRIWMFTGNKVWFTGWEEISSGVAEECVPSGDAGNFWAFDSEVTGVATVADGVLVFTASAIWKIMGDSLDTFRRVLIAQGLGCRNRATICSFGKAVAWLDVGNSVWLTDGESVMDIGTDILPDISAINHAQASMCFFNSKTFQWLCLLDGATGKLRIYDGRRQKWQVPWTIGGRSIWAGETAAGTTELIIGHSSGKCLKLSTTTFTDNGTNYSCSLRSNLFGISRAADTLGALHHIGLETNAFEPGTVKYLTDEDGDTGTFTDIAGNVRDAELRTQGTDLKDRWYPVAGSASKAARRIAMSFTWPADANHWKLYSYDLAYQKVGGRD